MLISNQDCLILDKSQFPNKKLNDFKAKLAELMLDLSHQIVRDGEGASKFITIKQVATKRNPRKGSIFNKVDHVTAISKDVARSISKKDVDVIYNGILKESEILEKSPNPIFTVVAIGRLDKIKGFDILIEEEPDQ